jgi:hypothetical protein
MLSKGCRSPKTRKVSMRLEIGLPPLDWEEVIPPRELRKIRRLEREYERLAKQIDKKYATGRVEGVEDLEQRAGEIEEKLFALHDVYMETVPFEDIEVSLDEELVRAYLFPPDYWTREEQIEVLQDVIRTHLLRAGRDVHPTPEQALEAAMDAAARWEELRRRYRRP